WFNDCGETEYFLEGTAPRFAPCWELDLAGLSERWSRRGDPDRYEDRMTLRQAERRLRERAREELDRLEIRGRGSERDAARQAERWIRERAEEELERLLRAAERLIERDPRR